MAQTNNYHVAKVLNNPLETMSHFYFTCRSTDPKEEHNVEYFDELIEAYNRVRKFNGSGDSKKFFEDMANVCRALRSSGQCCCLEGNKDWMCWIGSND